MTHRDEFERQLHDLAVNLNMTLDFRRMAQKDDTFVDWYKTLKQMEITVGSLSDTLRLMRQNVSIVQGIVEGMQDDHIDSL